MTITGVLGQQRLLVPDLPTWPSIPGGAIYVATTGNDTTGDGTSGTPYLTIQKAVDTVADGGTIVVKPGVYREAVTLADHVGVTIRAEAQGDAVWIDGSDAEATGGWTYVGPGALRKKTITGGGVDDTSNMGGVLGDRDEAALLAIFVYNGTPLTEIAYVDNGGVPTTNPAADEFAVNYANDEYWVFVNASAATSLDVGKREVGLTVDNSPDTTLLGIGFRYHVTTQSLAGAMRVLTDSPRFTMRDCTFSDNANIGAQIKASHSNIAYCTFLRNGRMGLSMQFGDRVTARYNLFQDNNSELFDTGAAAGGFKLTQARRTYFDRNKFDGNAGHGLWLDRSCLDAVITRNYLTGNAEAGIKFEVSGAGRIVSNSSIDDGYGIEFGGCADTHVWNNLIINPTYNGLLALNGQRDGTDPDNLIGDSFGVPEDDRYSPHPSNRLPWHVVRCTVKNNVLVDGPDDDSGAPYPMIRMTDAASARTVSDGVTTASDATLTSATANFVAGDVGREVTGTNIPTGTKIASINSSTSVEMDTAATGSGSSITLVINPKWDMTADNDLDYNIFHRTTTAVPLHVVGITVDPTGGFDRYTSVSAWNTAETPLGDNDSDLSGALTVADYPGTLMPAGAAVGAGAALPTYIAALVDFTGTAPQGLLDSTTFTVGAA